MKNKANIPKGYKLTKIGTLPVEWEVVKLETVATVQGGYAFKSKLFTAEGKYQVVKMANLYNGIFDLKRSQSFLHKIEKNEQAFLLEEGDLIMTLTGTLGKEDYGKSVLVPKSENLLLNQRVCRLYANAKSDQQYIYYLTKSRAYKRQFFFSARGGTGNQANVGTSDVKAIKIPLPPLPQQQKIAKILATWDKAIQTQTQLINTKKEQKRGLMQRLLTGEVRLPGFEKSKEKVKSRIGEVPADWEIIPAGKLFKSSSQKKNGELPLLAVTQENGVVDRNDLEGRVTMPSGSTEGYKLIEEGDFVISLRSFQGGLEFSEIKGIVSPAYTVLKNVKEIDKTFFKFFFKSHEFIQRLAATVIGIRDGKQISYKDFITLKFRSPPLKEQTAIANILTTADQEITLLETRLTELREQKRGLMQRLLTGAVRVTVPATA